MRVLASELWPARAGTRLECQALGEPHTWLYRGQVVPTNKETRVIVAVDAIDRDKGLMTASGFLLCDGLVIYKMEGFTVRVHS